MDFRANVTLYEHKLAEITNELNAWCHGRALLDEEDGIDARLERMRTMADLYRQMISFLRMVDIGLAEHSE